MALLLRILLLLLGVLLLLLTLLLLPLPSLLQLLLLLPPPGLLQRGHLAQEQAGGGEAAHTFFSCRGEYGAMPDAEVAKRAARRRGVSCLGHDTAVHLGPRACGEHVQHVGEELLLGVKAGVPLAVPVRGVSIGGAVGASQCRTMLLIGGDHSLSVATRKPNPLRPVALHRHGRQTVAGQGQLPEGLPLGHRDSLLGRVDAQDGGPLGHTYVRPRSLQYVTVDYRDAITGARVNDGRVLVGVQGVLQHSADEDEQGDVLPRSHLAPREPPRL